MCLQGEGTYPEKIVDRWGIQVIDRIFGLNMWHILPSPLRILLSLRYRVSNPKVGSLRCATPQIGRVGEIYIGHILASGRHALTD